MHIHPDLWSRTCSQCFGLVKISISLTPYQAGHTLCNNTLCSMPVAVCCCVLCGERCIASLMTLCWWGPETVGLLQHGCKAKCISSSRVSEEQTFILRGSPVARLELVLAYGDPEFGILAGLYLFKNFTKQLQRPQFWWGEGCCCCCWNNCSGSVSFFLKESCGESWVTVMCCQNAAANCGWYGMHNSRSKRLSRHWQVDSGKDRRFGGIPGGWVLFGGVGSQVCLPDPIPHFFGPLCPLSLLTYVSYIASMDLRPIGHQGSLHRCK